MNTYTAFCRDDEYHDEGGTTWIDTVEAADVPTAMQLARIKCAVCWEVPIDTVECIGILKGDVEVLHWED